MDSFKSNSNSEIGYNSQRNNGQQNEFEGQSASGPIVDYSTYTGRQAEGPLRRPNRSNTSGNSDVINSLSQQTNLLSINENIRSNDSNYSISTPDVTNSWKTSEPRQQSQPQQSSCMSSSSSIRSTSTVESTLSPFAKEFVPRTVMTYPNPPSIPNGTRMWSNYSENETVIPATRDFEDFIAISYLREFIDTITIKPNKYDTGIAYLTEVINSYIDEDDSVMETVVNTIVDQAIIDPQFRYNGVRLCIYFMQNLRDLSPETTFKLLLFKRCQREHARREVMIRGSDESESYLRGLTLFIGDLYSRCSAPELAEYLPQLLLTLMSNPHKENLKCVCQVLKLCGSTLESYYAEKKTGEMSRIMEGMKGCLNNSDISVYVKELISNIIEMQKRGWTASLIPAATPAVNPYLNTNYAENSVNTGDYYEDYNSYSDEEDFQASYDFGQCGDEEDFEVCEAFEQFLKNSGQTK
jgi:hypothetical protein